MEERIVDFIQVLRKSGIRVSPSEDVEALQAVQLLGLEERETFKTALRATLVKRGFDVPAFDRLFDLYFSGLREILDGSLNQLAEELARGNINLAEVSEEIEELLENLDHPFSPLAMAILTQNIDQLEQILRRAAQAVQTGGIENMLQVGYFTRRALDWLGFEKARQDLAGFRQGLEGAGLDPERLNEISEYIAKALENFRNATRQFIQSELEQHNYNYMERFRQDSLAEKSFYHLTEDDIRKMREVVNRLAQRLKIIVSMRKKRAGRGRFDLKHTLRRNMSHGGTLFELIFRRRRQERPRIVALCDISSSVSNVSRFMLQFIYTLQENFSKVRSYVFVAEIGEVTELFSEHDLFDAIGRALTGETINVYTRSNFGHAFHTFYREHLQAVDSKTTVIIIGDGRNNYHDPKAWSLHEIHRKAKRVLWLNPENPGAWGFGDSVMDKYVPHCDIVEECRNLKQLTQIVDRLLV